MGLTNIYDKIVQASPILEVKLRQLYWNNYKLLSKYKPKRNSSGSSIDRVAPTTLDFDKVLNYLKNNGCGNGEVVIVHSSYKSLKTSGLSAQEIIEKLISLIGHEGTLVMPVIRTYEEENQISGSPLEKDEAIEDIICVYDVQKTKVHTGFLPICLMNREGSVTSRYPLNTVTAYGLHAKDIIYNNLCGIGEAPNGPHSAWKNCLDLNAIIVCLGADVTHSLTMIHTNEDAYGDWPIKNWYRKRRFIIKDNDFRSEICVKERRPLWGAKYYLERNLRKDLLREHILRLHVIDGLEIGIIESQKLISYLRSRKKEGYPYKIPKKYFIK